MARHNATKLLPVSNQTKLIETLSLTLTLTLLNHNICANIVRISITRKQKPALYPYTLHGQQLKHVDIVKYLGIQISHDLCWDKHIDHITAKANSTLNFLCRNINISNPRIKEQSYTTLVRPVLEYSQTVWDPYTAGAVNRIGSVQHRAARFTLSRYRRTSSMSAMLARRLNHVLWCADHSSAVCQKPGLADGRIS